MPPANATELLPWPLHPTLAALLPRLELIQDCWDLLAGRKEHYLPRGEREPESAYRRRLEGALPSGFFRDALRTFAGMLASSHWRELPASLQAVISDVDGRGTDLGVFLERADVLVLRDGAALIGVLPPEHLWPSEGDRQQALRRGDRLSLPRLALLERRDVLNWHLPGPQSLPDAVSFRLPNPKAQDEPLDPDRPQHSWLYGSVALDGEGMSIETIELMADPQASTGWRPQRSGLQHYRGISQLPLIWYASDGAAFGEGDLPHLGLAHQYLNHFRCQSDYQELLYRTALPVGVRTGVVGPMGSGTSEPVVLGPNSVIDLPDGASFQFVEIQARSLAEHRAWLESLDQGMRRDALIPSGAQGAPRTATEISLAASQAYALLQSQAIQKASMFSSLLLHWCAITGEPVPVQQGPALLVEISPLAPAPKPQPTVAEMLQLHERGIVSEQALRQWLGDLAGVAPASA
ncbi:MULTISPECIES: DUF4055 domain-containing protein [unclassified Cyanobium]|uniref:DUF4055 domain-containing protein n=1 Tax=unclassified Cyanobium TaxID=2627006 RepID=UPI0020CC58FE|nr:MULTISPECIES: DUF4055 domain-containing protein [unclassified Cyanobium]